MGESHRSDGYTLVEIMVVVVILSILVLIAVASYWISIENAQKVTCQNNRRAFDSAAIIYENDTGEQPAQISDLADYAATFSNIVHCPAHPQTLLRWDTDLERTVCDFHETP